MSFGCIAYAQQASQNPGDILASEIAQQVGELEKLTEQERLQRWKAIPAKVQASYLF